MQEATSHLARTLFKVLMCDEKGMFLHSQGTSNRTVSTPTRDLLPGPITLVPAAATAPLAGTPPHVSLLLKQQQSL